MELRDGLLGFRNMRLRLTHIQQGSDATLLTSLCKHLGLMPQIQALLRNQKLGIILTHLVVRLRHGRNQRNAHRLLSILRCQKTRTCGFAKTAVPPLEIYLPMQTHIADVRAAVRIAIHLFSGQTLL